MLAGVPVGDALADDDPMLDFKLTPPGSGSVIALVATDAPLFPHQCQALARRVTAGLARTGTSGSHFSGDLFLAFSTANPGAFRPDDDRVISLLSFVPWERLDPFYEAVVQSCEEAVVNALVANEDMTGRDGHRTPALPRARVTELLATAGRLA
jgi:L-aminopeptidase/D-esterase-like protein